MRWLFLLLLVLNGFYYIWHQQEAPLRAKDVTPLSLYRGSQQDIHLLSETADSLVRRDTGKAGEARKSCNYLGGVLRPESARQLEQRLASLGVVARPVTLASPDSPEGGAFWLQIPSESAGKLSDTTIQNLSKEFNELKHKIMPCEGVAPAG
ncbi:hypothetical protein [Pseudomonas sp. SWRI154]|uniref:hypothetical protein n=1 Tax=Pseudomonas sp. SWRI154 TaxID=2745501 RepID=UPI00164754B1|nr:hypothetical protein [Pseudomonas sp. SWRI154]MBC3366318.1 hypothetical protein [Pseudomonas sp. SWRI154]